MPSLVAAPVIIVGEESRHDALTPDLCAGAAIGDGADQCPVAPGTGSDPGVRRGREAAAQRDAGVGGREHGGCQKNALHATCVILLHRNLAGANNLMGWDDDQCGQRYLGEQR